MKVDWQSWIMLAGLIIALPFLLIFMYRVQRDTSDLNFGDWFRGSNGKASWKEAQGIGGFLVGSWCMIYVTWTGRIPEGYAFVLLIYLGVCGGIPTALAIINRVYPAVGPEVPGANPQIKVDAPAGTDINIKAGGK